MPSIGSSIARAWYVPPPTPIFNLDLSGITPGVYTGHAGLDLTFTRASSAITQISASAMSATAANNQGLIKTFGVAGRVGHRVNRSYVQRLLESRALHTTGPGTGAGVWIAGAGVTYSDSGTSPRAGVVDARRVAITSGGYSNYAYNTAHNGDLTWSLWRRAHAGTTTHQIAYGRSVAGGGTDAVDSSTATTTWERRYGTATGNGAAAFYLGPATGGGFWPTEPDMAQDVYIDLVQLETGRIAHDCVLTAGATATSAAENLYSGSATNLVSGGRLTLWYRIIPDGGSGDYGTGSVQVFEHIHGGSNVTLAYWDASTRALTVSGAGLGSPYTFATVMPTWSAGDILDIWIEIGNGIVRAVVRVNEGVATVLGSAAVSGSIGSATDALRHIADASVSGGGATFDGSVVQVQAFASGDRMGWAR